MKKNSDLLNKYREVRKVSEKICEPLETEDYVVQPIEDVSPPKWHLGHTTWFFETFILIPNSQNYRVFDEQYNFVFNSYYETVGTRVIRTDRGNLSRPTVSDVYEYRRYVDDKMKQFLQNISIDDALAALIELGLNHEQQHQELLLTDIKYILGHNPLFPPYHKNFHENPTNNNSNEMVSISEGIYEIGFDGNGFCFDNELGKHRIFVNDFEICKDLVSNAEYLEFINSGGYEDFRFWHAEGWDWLKSNPAKSPLYWHFINGKWLNYTLNGLIELNPDEPVCHVNFFEASAFASWKEMRLPTEAEWEIASGQINWGKRWEWTNSAYLPYPGFKKEPGAVGEYNGKFMVNQMVLRGASEVTSPGHSRKTYRNFFQTHLQWQYMGIRLAR